jgi:hypothetical protein
VYGRKAQKREGRMKEGVTKRLKQKSRKEPPFLPIGTK